MASETNNSDEKKKVVVVKKADEKEIKKVKEDKVIEVPTGKQNLTPLGGPTKEEEAAPIVIGSEKKGEDKKTEVIVPDAPKNMEPLSGPTAEAKPKATVIGNADKSSTDKSSTEKSSTEKSKADDTNKKEGSKSEDKMAYPWSTKKSTCAKCNKDMQSCMCTASAKSDSSNKKDKSTSSSIGGAAPVGADKKCTKCNESAGKCPCTSSTRSSTSSSGRSGPQVKIDESKNQNLRTNEGVRGTGFVPAKLENPTGESVLHELRRKNSVLAEGFMFRKRLWFFCFWVQKYFVLLKTGELIWLETDGSGTGEDSWEVKKATAFNKLDYDGYTHAHRLTFSLESGTGYLAHDTTAERDYWYDALQDVSRS